MYVNVLVWSRVPETSARNPGALPMCGGVFGGGGDGSGGLTRADTANVAVHSATLAEEVAIGEAGGVLLDFLEHRNPEKNLRFDR